MDVTVHLLLDVFLFGFLYFLMKEGLSEWKGLSSPFSRSARIFALVVEIAMLLGIAWVLPETEWEKISIWNALYSILIAPAILALAIVDAFKLRGSISQLT